MLTMFIRSIILYLAALIAMRLMGKRQVGQLQPFELVVVIMIAELAATPMSSIGMPLLWGLLPMMALLICHGLFTFLDMRFPAFSRLLGGEPTVLIRDGVICEAALRRTGISLTDLMEASRVGGQQDISQVATAVLEPSGTISVFPNAQNRPLTPQDVSCRVQHEGLPLPLILDGDLHRGNLELSGLEEKQLRALVLNMGLGTIPEVLLLTLSSGGKVHAQGKENDKVVDTVL